MSFKKTTRNINFKIRRDLNYDKITENIRNDKRDYTFGYNGTVRDVSSQAELTTAIGDMADGDIINITDDITITADNDISADVLIKGNSNTLTRTDTNQAYIFTLTSKCVITDLTLTSDTDDADTQCVLVDVDDSLIYNCNLNFYGNAVKAVDHNVNVLNSTLTTLDDNTETTAAIQIEGSHVATKISNLVGNTIVGQSSGGGNTDFVYMTDLGVDGVLNGTMNIIDNSHATGDLIRLFYVDTAPFSGGSFTLNVKDNVVNESDSVVQVELDDVSPFTKITLRNNKFTNVLGKGLLCLTDAGSGSIINLTLAESNNTPGTSDETEDGYLAAIGDSVKIKDTYPAYVLETLL